MLNRVLELLENLGKRPGMYVAGAEIANVQSFLYGLRAGCRFNGLDVTVDTYIKAAAKRGWKWRATGIVWHMREKGLDDAAIIQELIAVEAEAFRITAGSQA